MELKDKSLLKAEAFVGGSWTAGEAGRVEVRDPASGAVIASVPRLGRRETAQAIEAAARAFPAWRRQTAKERGRILRRWAELMAENTEDLARIMTAEQGKPLAESRGEIAYAASFLEWFAEEGRRIYGDTIPSHRPDTRIVVTKEPVGVTAGITPWNFPAAMITRKAAPALAAGCPMVVKPAEQTPLSALALAVLAERAGLPEGVLSVITGAAEDAPVIGGELTANPLVRKLGFTGSTEVGKLLMRQCAGTVKKISLELGGNAPFIVFDDADIDQAVEGAIISKFRNTGQTCVCANRVLVQAKVYDAFAERLAARVAAMKVGPGLEEGVVQGPLIDMQALAKVERHVEDALALGARVAVGGGRHALGGTFYQPTVLTQVSTDMLLTREETFGPVAGLIRFSSEEEAIRIANDTPFGLAAYFYSRDIGRIWRVSEGLDYGMVGINTGLISTAEAPFGGVKESGIGREGSKYGIEEFVSVKYLCMGGLDR
ncbi:MAG: NADP-dependent succinate-semialdehyde dehydrogenase [Thalassobaculales bacterium]